MTRNAFFALAVAALAALADLELARRIAHGQWEPTEEAAQTG